MVIRSVVPLSVAKVAGALYAMLGLIIGAMISLIAVAGGLSNLGSEGAVFSVIFGMGAVVLLPILYGGMGFVMSLVMAWLYNVVAGMVGGVEIDVL